MVRALDLQLGGAGFKPYTLVFLAPIVCVVIQGFVGRKALGEHTKIAARKTNLLVTGFVLT